jgi:pimeloyl-ACP methyl ester carboxylesterase
MAPDFQPVVIFGGFLSYSNHYRDMQAHIEAITGQKVTIVNTRGYDWLPIMSIKGWIYLIHKLDEAVMRALNGGNGQEVIIIGHSIGGVLSKIYLLDDPFPGEDFRGPEAVTHLVTLGSPHSNKGGLTRGGLLTRWIDKKYPGCVLAPNVRYTSIAGKFMRGNNNGSTREHWVYQNYRSICGKGDVWGDGLIPIDCALMEGSQKIVLDNISHAQIFGNPWYGDKESVGRILSAIG